MKTITLTSVYAKATKGPWLFAPSGPRMAEAYSQPFAIYEALNENLIAGVFGDVRGGESVARANAALLAHSFNVLPEVVEELTRLRDSLKRNGYATSFTDDILAKANQVQIP